VRLPNYVFTLDAAIALLNGNNHATYLVREAEAGRVYVFIPASVLAEVRAGRRTMEAVLMTPGVECIPLTEAAAIDLPDVPESLDDRHVALEAEWLGATVVAAAGQPWWGKGRPVLTI